MPEHALSQQILEALGRRMPPVAFVSEIAATIRPAADQPAIEAALRDLVDERQVLIASHAAPDVHLKSSDLRVVAPLADGAGEGAAEEAANAYWNSWLRAFLATHRCQ
ncbi:MAG TPA: hypothetical protein VGK54_12445 [Chloroflexota bacterium]|jgi:hypothetical protein